MSREAIQDIFRNTGAEALFVTDPHNMWYLSGFRGGEGMVYISPKQQVLITDGRFSEAAERESRFPVIVEKHAQKRSRILRKLLTEDGASIVGYEDKFMRCNEFSRLQNAIPEVAQWLPLDEQIDAIRQVKSPEELEKVQAAIRISEESLEALLKILKPGMTELLAAAELEYQMRIHGGQALAFPTIMASGANSSMSHSIPTERKIQEGDIILMDFGCVVDGYCSDISRTFIMGKADEKAKQLYSIVSQAYNRVMDTIRAGMSAYECDAIARSVIVEAGYGDYFTHATGHGLGLYYHERPNLSTADSAILEEGMIVTVEPGIYIPGFGGMRIEDTVVIEKDGVRRLNSLSPELVELPVI